MQMTTSSSPESSTRQLNAIRRTLAYLLNELSPASLNGLVFTLYYNLFTQTLTQTSLQSTLQQHKGRND